MDSGCRCGDEALMWGLAADDYSTDHLIREAIADGGAEIVYRCPATGRRWIGEFVTDDAACSTFRLRKLLRAVELVEFLAHQQDPKFRLAWLDPEVEFNPPGSKTIYRGVGEAERWSRIARTDPDFPRP